MRTRLAMLKIERLGTIQVCAFGDTVTVLVPDGAGVVRGVEAERVRVLAEAVQIRVVGEVGPETNVLGFKDQGCSGGVEEDFV